MKFWPFRRRRRKRTGLLDASNEIAEALGLDPDNIRGITLVLNKGSYAMATVEVYISKVQNVAVAEVMRQYQLVPRKEVEEYRLTPEVARRRALQDDTPREPT